MAITILWASPDTDGLTASAKRSILTGIQSAGGTAIEIHLNRKNIKACLACGKGGYGVCRSEGRCILNDDFSQLYDACCSAEALVFVSPVYWHDMSENFKSFLDRLRRCETSKNGYLKEKRYVAVACAGGYGLGVTTCLDRMETTLGHMGLRALDRIPVTRYNRDYMLPALVEAGRVLATQHSAFQFDAFHFW